MKKLVEVPVKVETKVVDEEGGLITLLGKRVFFHCANYNYAGKLTGVNENQAELSEAEVVFETGPYASMSKGFKLSERVSSTGKLFVRFSAIEAYWELT